MKYAIFDFCHTIVDFDTGDPFVEFVADNVNNKLVHFKIWVVRFLRSVKFIRIVEKFIAFIGYKPSMSFNKAITLNTIKGVNKKDIEQLASVFYRGKIKDHLIAPIDEMVKNCAKEGYQVIIVSASYYPIVNLYAEEHKISSVVTNEFLYINDRFSGKIQKPDCIGEKKVFYFDEKFPGLYKNAHEGSLSFGDNFSDRFILDHADKGIVVSYKQHQKWVENTSFEEIIYE